MPVFFGNLGTSTFGEGLNAVDGNDIWVIMKTELWHISSVCIGNVHFFDALFSL